MNVGRSARGGQRGFGLVEILGAAVNPPDDGRLRRVFTTTIAFRNRAL
jgi:hypothetical protein